MLETVLKKDSVYKKFCLKPKPIHSLYRISKCKTRNRNFQKNPVKMTIKRLTKLQDWKYINKQASK